MPNESCCLEETSDSYLDQTTQEYLISCRRIFLNGDIHSNLANTINAYLQYYAVVDKRKPVYMYISSSGGDVIAGYSIIDQMELSPFPIYTIVRGCAYSMAAVIAAFGSKKCRFITNNSSMMIHESIFMPDIDTLELQKRKVEFLSEEDDQKMKCLSSRLNVRYNKLIDMSKKNYWMNAKEAIKIGFVDGIWSKEMEQYVNDTRDFAEEKTNH